MPDLDRFFANNHPFLVGVILDGPFASTTRMDLSLDDRDLPAQFIVGGHGFVRSRRNDPLQHRHTSLAE